MTDVKMIVSTLGTAEKRNFGFEESSIETSSIEKQKGNRLETETSRTV